MVACAATIFRAGKHRKDTVCEVRMRFKVGLWVRVMVSLVPAVAVDLGLMVCIIVGVAGGEGKDVVAGAETTLH